MQRIISRSYQALFFSEEGREYDAALRAMGHGGQRTGQLDHRHSSAAIVVRAVVNSVALAGGLHSKMVVMRAHENTGILQLVVGATKESHHVARRHCSL